MLTPGGTLLTPGGTLFHIIFDQRWSPGIKPAASPIQNVHYQLRHQHALHLLKGNKDLNSFLCYLSGFITSVFQK